MEKIAPLSLSAVGRTASPGGVASVMPRALPAITRTAPPPPHRLLRDPRIPGVGSKPTPGMIIIPLIWFPQPRPPRLDRLGQRGMLGESGVTGQHALGRAAR